MRIQAYPAYGRKFTSVEALLDSWNKNQDFALAPVSQALLHTGTYINKSDFDYHSSRLGVTGIDLKCGGVVVTYPLSNSAQWDDPTVWAHVREKDRRVESIPVLIERREAERREPK